jgi:hypothetical protein
MKLGSILVVMTWIALGTGSARAQRAPDLVTLDRGDGITRLGLDAGMTIFDEDTALFDYALRFEPYGQYVFDSGVGLYGAMPFAYASGDQDAFALGNLDLGMLYVLDSPALSWVFRGGLALPTADDDLEGALANYSATLPRLTDTSLTVADAFYVRLAISPLLHVNRWFLRADLGFDLGLNDEAASELIRFNVGAGYDVGTVALALELVNLATLDDFGGDEDFLHTLTFAVRFMTRSVEPYIAVGAPLDEVFRGDIFIAAGLQFPIR